MSSLKPWLSSLLAVALLLASGSGRRRARDPKLAHHERTFRSISFRRGSCPSSTRRVLFNAGSARDGERPGLAQLTNALLEEGAGDWSADMIADRLDQVGARLERQFAARFRLDCAAQPQ
jgi:zinc protease